VRLDDLLGGERRGTKRADFALALQVGQRREGLLHRGVRVRPVHLVQVDPVRIETAQAVVHFPDDPAPRVAALVRIAAGLAHHRVHGEVDLRRQDHLVATAVRERFADNHLRLAL
jgi:hypothetical protein